MIYDKLYDWQKSIVDKFKNKHSFGLFLDMGLGKTPISLAFAEQNKCTKIIIVSINTKAIEDNLIQGSWFNWNEQTSTPFKYYNKFSLSEISQISQNENSVLLLNYESLFSRKDNKLRTEIVAFIKSCKDCNCALIIDESHKVKNLQSKQTKSIFKIQSMLNLISKNCFTYLLTGTPFTTGYIDLYSQLKLLGYTDTKSVFIDNFCIRGYVPGLLGWQQPIVGYKNLDELYKLIHMFALTIKSEDVINLPEQIFVEHETSFSNVFNLFTNEKLKDVCINKELKYRNLDTFTENNTNVNNPFYRNIAYPEMKWIADTNGVFWLRARQLSIGFQGNAEDCIWYDKRRLIQLKTFLEQNESNYVLFYNYTPELTEIYAICEELGYNIDLYCGEMKSLYFYNKYIESNDTEKLINTKNIILANFASGSTGMNWQAYSNCILFSVPLFKDYEQGIKRIHRIGQKNTTVYHIFYQKNWLDYSMRKALTEAKNYNQQMFNSDVEQITQIKGEL